MEVFGYGVLLIVWSVLTAILVPMQAGTIQGGITVLFLACLACLLFPAMFRALKAEWYRRKVNPNAYRTVRKMGVRIRAAKTGVTSLAESRAYPEACEGFLAVLMQAEKEIGKTKRLLGRTDCRGRRVVDDPWTRLMDWKAQMAGSGQYQKGLDIGMDWCGRIMGPARKQKETVGMSEMDTVKAAIALLAAAVLPESGQ